MAYRGSHPLKGVPGECRLFLGGYSLGRFYLRRYGQFDAQPAEGLLELGEEGLKPDAVC
jgi:hypothetical protein